MECAGYGVGGLDRICTDRGLWLYSCLRVWPGLPKRLRPLARSDGYGTAEGVPLRFEIAVPFGASEAETFEFRPFHFESRKPLPFQFHRGGGGVDGIVMAFRVRVKGHGFSRAWTWAFGSAFRR